MKNLRVEGPLGTLPSGAETPLAARAFRPHRDYAPCMNDRRSCATGHARPNRRIMTLLPGTTSPGPFKGRKVPPASRRQEKPHSKRRYRCRQDAGGTKNSPFGRGTKGDVTRTAGISPAARVWPRKKPAASVTLTAGPRFRNALPKGPCALGLRHTGRESLPHHHGVQWLWEQSRLRLLLPAHEPARAEPGQAKPKQCHRRRLGDNIGGCSVMKHHVVDGV